MNDGPKIVRTLINKRFVSSPSGYEATLLAVNPDGSVLVQQSDHDSPTVLPERVWSCYKVIDGE